MNLRYANIPLGLRFIPILMLAASAGCASAQDLFEKGVAEEGKGNQDQALSYYSQSIQADSNFVKAWNNRGLILYRQKNLDEAEKNLEEALKRKPDYASALVNRGLVLEARGRLQEALESYAAASKADPRSIPALFNAGNLSLKMKNAPGAMTYLEAALLLAPTDKEIKRAAARAWLDGGRPGQAYEMFRSLYAEDEKDEEALAGLVQSSRSLGLTKQAIGYAEKYAVGQANCLPCMSMLASLYLEDHALPNALAILERARDRFPADPTVRYRLALLYAGANRKNDGIKQLEEYARLRPEAKDAEAEAASNLLHALKKGK